MRKGTSFGSNEIVLGSLNNNRNPGKNRLIEEPSGDTHKGVSNHTRPSASEEYDSPEALYLISIIPAYHTSNPLQNKANTISLTP
ncbi:unnamed protein product [Arctia plantaginis]|uniref:Uncharacterized protein n=1 Tax=Arctia plantaginis TaxID=874455 RepID=A0A8S0Z7K3_ARCPL|nr:unnamed protein product [Arctia plantaginis]CAB3248496.1 unnamed protein product [Arctia plantaginis]